MKGYGLNLGAWNNDSKKIGDYWGTKKPRSFLSDKNLLRGYKKIARREAKIEIVKELING